MSSESRTKPVPEMHYHEHDVAYVWQSLPYLRLSKHRSSLTYARDLLRRIRIWQWVLVEYPYWRCERLEPVYAVMTNLGALDELFMEDLLNHHTFRGQMIGGFLATIQPRDTFEPLLRESLTRAHHDGELFWLNHGHARVRGEPLDESELTSVMNDLSRALARVHLPKTPLRRLPPTDFQETFERESTEASRLYKTQGSRAALEYIRTTMCHLYTQPYERWRASLETFVEKEIG